MKRLTLIRHGKSSWASLAQEDYERPLNSRGLRDCDRMPALIASKIPRPQALLSSGAVRAKMTSEAIAAGYAIAADDIEYLPALYQASLDTLLECIRDQADALEHLMLVGHNPGLTELYNHLCPQSVDNLPTLAVADLLLDIDSWQAIHPHCASAENFLKPKLIG